MIPEFKFALFEGFTDPQLLPTRANDLDAGWDVRCATLTRISRYKTVLIPLGIKVICPEGWWLELKPRSSTHFKKHLHCLNGVIDNGYEGHIQLCSTYISQHEDDFFIRGGEKIYEDSLDIEAGERIAQLIPRRLEQMYASLVSEDEFSKLSLERKNSRGAGGFGSSGKV